MDDIQLNICVEKKPTIKSLPSKNASEYKFVKNSKFVGKTIARKRPISAVNSNDQAKKSLEPQEKVAKLSETGQENGKDLMNSLRDLSENKGKYVAKNYQELSDNLSLKPKHKNGTWISSLFKNNPSVPQIANKNHIRPIVEKVFAGKTFVDLDIHPHSVANLQQNMNLTEMMTVQQNAIPILLRGRDVLIRSQTGSGKTLAYALPIVEGLQAIRPKINRHDGIRVIVVVPTRELALQTYELFIKLVKPFTWLVPGLLSGGQKRKAEKARLRKGLNILIGTPGRINDHLRHTKSLNFAKTGCLVLDEADRLLDMGYERDVAAIVKCIEDHKKAAEYDPMALMKQSMKTYFNEEKNVENEKTEESATDEQEIKHNLTKVFLSKDRQTILLSATLTKAVENLAGITMVDPVFVDASEGKAIVADSLKETIPCQGSAQKDTIKKDVTDTNNIEIKSEEKDSYSLSSKSKRGFAAFNGSKYAELFKKDDENSKVNVANDVKNEDSDSDSDYDFFKANKDIEYKRTNVGIVEVKKEELAPSVAGTTFVDALNIAIVEDELILPDSVKQNFIVVPMKLRLVTLCALILEHCVLKRKGGKIIVFMATLEMVDYHSDLLETVLCGSENNRKNNKNKKQKDSETNENGNDSNDAANSDFEIEYTEPSESGIVPVSLEMFKLHGSMPHEQRMEVFKKFRSAKSGVLICTDVAARGIDVPRVDLVLQYCAPTSATDYVHRVGRTGRAAHVGAAVLFLLPSETKFVEYLAQKRISLRQMDQEEPLEALRSIAPKANNKARAAIALQSQLEYTAHSSMEWLTRASRAYTSWVRFYSGYPHAVRQWLDSKSLHLGHAAKAFALRDTPSALSNRAKSDAKMKKEKPSNRLTVHEEEEMKRPGFSKLKLGLKPRRSINEQSSMHTASEFDSGIPPTDHRKNKKHKAH